MLSLDHLHSPWARTLRARGLCVGVLVGLIGMYLGFVFVVLAHRRGVAAFSGNNQVADSPIPSDSATPGPSSPALDSSTPSPAVEADGVSCEQRPLPDLGFELVPRWGVSELLEVWLLVGILITLGRFTFSSIGSTVLRRWFFAVGVLSMSRGLARMLTVRPPTVTNMCMFHDRAEDNPMLVAFATFFKQASSCVDVVFALHVVHITLVSLVWLYYVETVGPMGVGACTIRVTVVMYCLIGYLLITSTRAHYTADIFVWASFTAALWVGYHHWVVLLRLDSLGVLGSELHYSRNNWFASFVLWFEAGAEDLYFLGMPDVAHADGSNHKSFYSSNKPYSQASLEESEFDDGFEDVGPHAGPSIVFDGRNTPTHPMSSPISTSGFSLRGYESFGQMTKSNRL